VSTDVAAVLARHLGLEVSSIGASALKAAISERAKARGVDIDSYARALDGNRTELAALVDEIVVPESWFFRDRIPFQHLAQHAARLVRKGKHVRVLSAPCSTGEEPYSVAMALVDLGIAARQVTIDAIDVSPPLLEAAREGIYRKSSFRGVEERFRTEYFVAPKEKAEETWQLAEGIRSMVRFRTANLVTPDFLGAEKPYDIILCRNLLIYLTSDARAIALGRLAELLAEGGILVVGHAEALEVIDPRFKGIGVTGSFTYTLRGAEERAPAPREKTTPMRRAADKFIHAATVREIRDARTQPVKPLAKPAEPRDLLAEATAHADRGELTVAAGLVEQHLAASGADGNAWALLGTIRQASSDLARAEECFSRALYCDPTLYTALVQLALLLDRRGESKGAAQLRARAERAKGNR
jgi:chemotaxis protein methyltransferase WspC